MQPRVALAWHRLAPPLNDWIHPLPCGQSTAMDGVLKGVYSEYVYRSMEASVDGIIEFKVEEEGKSTRDLIRIRSMRNVHFDREWHELKTGDNFEVTLEK